MLNLTTEPSIFTDLIVQIVALGYTQRRPLSTQERTFSLPHSTFASDPFLTLRSDQ